MTLINFGRGICGNPDNAASREWLVTNGIGGFASGTISGELTRRYHGLLIAALHPPLGRTLLGTKIDESIQYGVHNCPLFTNRWASNAIDPEGFRYIENFRLEGAIPTWTFACADALLEKRIWMENGKNTTYILYQLRRASAPVTISGKILINYRDFHSSTRGGWQIEIEKFASGLRFIPFEGAVPFYIHTDRAGLSPQHEWYQGFSLRVEQYRGFEGLEDHLYAGKFEVTLHPGEYVTLVASTEASSELNGRTAYAKRQAYEKSIIMPFVDQPDWVQQLSLAADQFIVSRPSQDAALQGVASQGPVENGTTVIAGYHWFGDWGRDTMIALPGLTLTTRRAEITRSILLTFSQFIDQGMLPNRFPDAGEMPEYNTVDATLWYFEAIRAYLRATGDDDLLSRIFPALKSIIDWHQHGTRYQILVDPVDGLLYAGEQGVQLTWMDAKIGDWVVTPRIGKPVEVNALWYNALCSMAGFAERLGEESRLYDQMARQVYKNFGAFWYQSGGYCYDVIDGPEGKDATLRPNQLLAVSLQNSPLNPSQQKAVVDVCARHLITSHGLRSLAGDHPAYAGRYGGDSRQRDSSYHQGTVWSWLLGPFVSAHLRVYGNPGLAASFLDPIVHHLGEHGLGSVSEIFDGDAPFTPRGCIAQAWGVAEVLRAWQALEEASKGKALN